MAKTVFSTVFLLTAFLGAVAVPPLPAQTEAVVDTALHSEPTERDWRPPIYPPAAIKAKVEGRVTVEFVVDEQGRVVDPRIKQPEKADPLLSEAVLAQAAQWSFAPALEAGRPVARSVQTTVSFFLKGRGGKPSVSLPLALEIPPKKEARAIAQPDPEYPEFLLDRKLTGRVVVGFMVSAEGAIKELAVLYASDAEFVGEALRTVRRWKFEPGRQGVLKVRTEKKAELEFFAYGNETKREDILTANGIAGWQDAGLEVNPLPLVLTAPVYPRERLIAGETGEAEVSFTLNERGQPTQVTVTKASQPEFGRALVAAVELWGLRPASKGGQTLPVTLRVKHAFKMNPQGPEARVVAAIKGGEIAGAKGLDARLTPVWRVPPQYPEALLAERPVGSATIEFIIDREGRARFPRVVSATHEAFGWAAAAAISQWVFVPPTRKGEAVDVRVSIPVEFAPPDA